MPANPTSTIFEFIVGIFIFSYILIIAAVIGLILFLFASIRDKFSKHKKSNHHLHGKYEGRVIDQDEVAYQAHVSDQDDKNKTK